MERAALRRLERARNLAKHELEKRVPVFVSINAKRDLEDPCERPYQVSVGPVGDCGKSDRLGISLNLIVHFGAGPPTSRCNKGRPKPSIMSYSCINRSRS